MASMLAVMLWGVGSGFGLLAQESDAERLRRLEEHVKKQQAEIEALKKGTPAASAGQEDGVKPPLETYWEDGLRFRSKDKNFEAHVGGRIVLHGRTIFDRPDDNTAPLRSVPDSLFFREAYLEADAKIYKEFGVKVQADFRTGTINQTTGAGASPIQGTLRDGYISWKRWNEFNVRLGQFYEPISQEDQTSFRFTDFAERSVMNRLLTGREVGVEFRGTIDEGFLSYRLMLANGNTVINDQGRSVVDREDEKQIAGRIMVKPLLHSGSPWLAGLELGLGGSIEDVDNLAVTAFDLTTTELSVLYLDSTGGGTFDGRRTRLMPQLSWTLGPVLLRGEYLVRSDELDDTFPDDELESKGWYAYATWLVTGEAKKPETRVTPAGDWGALELAVRFSRVEIDNAFDNGLAAAVGNTEKVTSVTAGVNWWIKSNIRLTLNIVREKYEDELQFESRDEDTLLGLILRAQIDF
jgi:phosphate-selective porin